MLRRKPATRTHCKLAQKHFLFADHRSNVKSISKDSKCEPKNAWIQHSGKTTRDSNSSPRRENLHARNQLITLVMKHPDRNLSDYTNETPRICSTQYSYGKHNSGTLTAQLTNTLCKLSGPIVQVSTHPSMFALRSAC